MLEESSSLAAASSAAATALPPLLIASAAAATALPSSLSAVAASHKEAATAALVALSVASAAALAAQSAGTVASAAAELASHASAPRVRAAAKSSSSSSSATTISTSIGALAVDKPALNVTAQARGRAVSIYTKTMLDESATFEQRCGVIMAKFLGFRFRRICAAELFECEAPSAAAALGGTIDSVRERVRSGAFSGEMSAFVNAVRAVINSRWNAFPPKSLQRTVASAAARFFEQLVAGPRCSPRNISAGYRAAAKETSAVVTTPSFRLVAPPPCAGDFRRPKDHYITFTSKDYASLEKILVDPLDTSSRGGKPTTSRARAASAAKGLEEGRWSAAYGDIFHKAIWTDPFLPETDVSSRKRRRKVAAGAPGSSRSAASAAALKPAKQTRPRSASATTKTLKRRRKEDFNDVLDPTDRRPAKGQKAVSHYRGVSWNKADSKWETRIRHMNKRHYLGAFLSEKAAARAYDAAAKQYHGEKAVLNFINGVKVPKRTSGAAKSRRASDAAKRRPRVEKRCLATPPPPNQLGESSKYRGVCWRKADEKWEARIRHNNVRHYLGYFLDEHAAARAYDVAAVRLHGKKANLNFPPGKPGDPAPAVLAAAKAAAMPTPASTGSDTDSGRDNAEAVARNSRAERSAASSGSRSSRWRGVSWCKRRQKWSAALTVQGIRHRLGVYVDESDAARAYDSAASRLVGATAVLNFVDAAAKATSVLSAAAKAKALKQQAKQKSKAKQIKASVAAEERRSAFAKQSKRGRSPAAPSPGSELKRSDVVGSRVARYFGGSYGWVLGVVTSVISDDARLEHSARAKRQRGKTTRRLWHVVHDDGDEEDLSDSETAEALKNFKERPKKGKAAGGKKAVTATAAAALKGGKASQITMGSEIEVFWDTKSAFGWFVGQVKQKQGGTGRDAKQLVVYEDGHESWTNLHERRWRLKTK